MQKYLSGEIDFKFDIRRNMVVFDILIKIAEAMIYTFLACAPTGTSKLSFFNEASKDWNNL